MAVATHLVRAKDRRVGPSCPRSSTYTGSPELVYSRATFAFELPNIGHPLNLSRDFLLDFGLDLDGLCAWMTVRRFPDWSNGASLPTECSAPTATLGPMLRAVSRPGVDLELEQKLVEHAKNGDQRAIRSLLETYGPVLYRGVLLPRLGDEARAKDALADTYTRVVTGIAKFNWHPAGIYPWLRTIAFHVAIDQLRQRKREMPFDVDDLEREADRRAVLTSTDTEYIEEEERRTARKQVELGLSKLNPRYAQAIRLRVIEEQPREDVARQLGATPATFDVVLHRAMAALKKVLQDMGHESDTDRKTGQTSGQGDGHG